MKSLGYNLSQLVLLVFCLIFTTSCSKGALVFSSSSSASSHYSKTSGIDKSDEICDISDTSQPNKCLNGATSQNKNETDTEYQWECVSADNEVATCSMPKPIDGKCDPDRRYGCLEKTLFDIDSKGEDTTQHTWECEGLHGGKTSLQCTLSKSSDAINNGSCNHQEKGKCHAGTASSVTDTGTHYNWQCVGSNVGSTNNEDPCSIEYRRILDGSASVTRAASDELDVLFVIDNSLSMTESLKGTTANSQGILESVSSKLKKAFENVSSNLLQATNWQMAFMNTDEGTDPGYEGKFYNLRDETAAGDLEEILVDGNEVQILSQALEDDYDLLDLFSNTIGHIGENNIRFHHERPLHNIIKALDYSGNQEFFSREDSTLAVIIVTDEDEEKGDGDKTKGQTQRISEVKTAVTGKLGESKKFITYGILLKDNECLQKQRKKQGKIRSEQTVGTVIMQLVQETGGITMCLAEDYSSILNEISSHIAAPILFDEIQLPHQNIIDNNQKSVTFSPSENFVEVEFDFENGKITFPNGPPAYGTTVAVSYEYYQDVSH